MWNSKVVYMPAYKIYKLHFLKLNYKIVRTASYEYKCIQKFQIINGRNTWLFIVCIVTFLLQHTESWLAFESFQLSFWLLHNDLHSAGTKHHRFSCQRILWDCYVHITALLQWVIHQNTVSHSGSRGPLGGSAHFPANLRKTGR